MRWLPALFVLLCCVGRTQAADSGFAAWLGAFRADAVAQGIAPTTLDRAFAGVQPIERVIELDRAQPETTLTFTQYLDKVVTGARREAARDHYRANQALLDAIGQRYGVQPRYIVALWGIETDFGRTIGSFPVVAALATLAFDGRRSAFFRRELINALLIIQQDNIDPKTMIGSWAGAMGQSQFMPSSFLAYAVSYRGNATPDIWTKPEDVFASIANYLARRGWHGDQGWGKAVILPPGFDSSGAASRSSRPLADWAALGLRGTDGSALPVSALRASLLQPGGRDGPAFLVYDNFSVILRWNNSSYFGVAVGTLADSVK